MMPSVCFHFPAHEVCHCAGTMNCTFLFCPKPRKAHHPTLRMTTLHVGPQFLDQALNWCALQWKHRALTTGPPGNSLQEVLSVPQVWIRYRTTSYCTVALHLPVCGPHPTSPTPRGSSPSGTHAHMASHRAATQEVTPKVLYRGTKINKAFEVRKLPAFLGEALGHQTHFAKHPIVQLASEDGWRL